jgi:heat shock protein HslJ
MREVSDVADPMTIRRSKFVTPIVCGFATFALLLLSLGRCDLVMTPQDADVSTGEPVHSLDGTAWMLVSLNGHRLIKGSQITLCFSDGFIRGYGGCNAYRPLVTGTGIDRQMHTYTATVAGPPSAEGYLSGSLGIPLFIHTDKDCPSPSGVMRQESVYFETLRDADRYRIVDDLLEIDNAKGETMLMFVREDSICTDTPRMEDQ